MAASFFNSCTCSAGAWQRSGCGKGDSTERELARRTAPGLSFQTHHDQGPPAASCCGAWCPRRPFPWRRAPTTTCPLPPHRRQGRPELGPVRHRSTSSPPSSPSPAGRRPRLSAPYVLDTRCMPDRQRHCLHASFPPERYRAGTGELHPFPARLTAVHVRTTDQYVRTDRKNQCALFCAWAIKSCFELNALSRQIEGGRKKIFFFWKRVL